MTTQELQCFQKARYQPYQIYIKVAKPDDAKTADAYYQWCEDVCSWYRCAGYQEGEELCNVLAKEAESLKSDFARIFPTVPLDRFQFVLIPYGDEQKFLFNDSDLISFSGKFVGLTPNEIQ